MRKNRHTCNHAGCHKSFTTSSSLTVHKVEKGAAAAARAGCEGGVGAGGRFCASQERGTPAQHLHNMQRPWLRGRAALRPAV